MSLEVKQKKLQLQMSYFIGRLDIEKVLLSNKISSCKKTMNTLLVTCMKIIKLSD